MREHQIRLPKSAPLISLLILARHPTIKPPQNHTDIAIERDILHQRRSPVLTQHADRAIPRPLRQRSAPVRKLVRDIVGRPARLVKRLRPLAPDDRLVLGAADALPRRQDPVRVQLERGVEARPNGDSGDLAVARAQAGELGERLRHAEEVLADAGGVELGAKGSDEAALCVFGGEAGAGRIGVSG